MSKKARAPLARFQVGELLQRMAIDVAGPLHETKQGNQYIIVLMDYLTKFVKMIPVPDRRAETCTKMLVTRVFAKVGLFRSLHSDQGCDFLSDLFSNTCKFLQVERTRTTPWRP